MIIAAESTACQYPGECQGDCFGCGRRALVEEHYETGHRRPDDSAPRGVLARFDRDCLACRELRR